MAAILAKTHRSKMTLWLNNLQLKPYKALRIWNGFYAPTCSSMECALAR